jgi:hypothetical protein
LLSYFRFHTISVHSYIWQAGYLSLIA